MFNLGQYPESCGLPATPKPASPAGKGNFSSSTFGGILKEKSAKKDLTVLVYRVSH